MDRSIRLALAKRIQAIAARVFNITYNEDITYEENDTLIIDLLSKTPLRRIPLRLIIKSSEIEINGIISNGDNIVSHINAFKHSIREILNTYKNKIQIELMEGETIDLKLSYASNTTLVTIDELMTTLFNLFVNTWKEIILHDHNYAANFFNIISVDFFGHVFFVALKDYNEIKDYLTKCWLPRPFLTIPTEDGTFLNSLFTIDYIRFPILSRISRDEKNTKYTLYILSNSNEVIKFDLTEVVNTVLETLIIATKYHQKLNKYLKILKANDRIIAEDPTFLENIIIRLKEIIHNNEQTYLLKINPNPFRPAIFKTDNISNYRKQMIEIPSEEKIKLEQLLKKLESYLALIKLVHSENTIFRHIFLSRIIASLVSNYRNVSIIYGDTIKELEKNIRRTKSYSSITIRLNELGIKPSSEKALLKIIDSGKKRYIVIEI